MCWSLKTSRYLIHIFRFQCSECCFRLLSLEGARAHYRLAHKAINKSTLLLHISWQSYCRVCLSRTKRDTVALTLKSREYWMIYRGPGFLAVSWLLACPLPPLLSLSTTGNAQNDWDRETTFWRERGGGEWLARSRTIRPQESLILYKSFNALLKRETLVKECRVRYRDQLAFRHCPAQFSQLIFDGFFCG